MFNFWTVMYLLFVGVVAGYTARLLVRGADPMAWWQTILLGIVGSFVGGFGAYVLFVGVVAGYTARLLVRGADPMAWWQTILLGIVGSFVGGFGAYVLFGWDEDEGFLQPSGLIASILGAIVALLIWRAIAKRSKGTTAA